MMSHFSLLLVFVATFTVAIPKPEEGHDKVVRQQEHFQNNDHHDKNYDHEAFLGEESATFDQLSPAESKRRLGLIVDKIDNDNNKLITKEELKDWILFTQRRYIREDVDRQWEHHNPDRKKSISWDMYKNTVYGFMEAQMDGDSEEELSHKKMLERDRRRWSVADRDGDDELTREEFKSFLHPEETEHMKDLMAMEAFEDIDKDGDGKISIEEYIGDMYREDSEDEIEPDWVKTEREQFSKYRDKDGDNYLNLEEVKNWISPPEFDHSEAEARHLIYEADADADQQLTKEEIINKYDLFVGSQATDFGEALARHDEF